ncbi:MAG: hypothetical protein PME_48150 [Priestia megaterium]|jgi:hypothetical protein|nr:hypothetical protein [Priestia megaterium]RCX26672.1 hypothetical protein DEU47_10245 [Bacillus sp. AG236]RMA92130.1 hypothetical protein DEU44_4234 [Priestia megaterium]CAH0125460.1 hypothetical protein SRABI82_00045 [Priestia megaterium]CJF81433.1 Uncharacterised protein [Streptococcus pneumoniae]
MIGEFVEILKKFPQYDFLRERFLYNEESDFLIDL